MKKAIVCIALALLLVVVTQRQVAQSLYGAIAARFGAEEATASEAQSDTKRFSEQLGTQTKSDTLGVTLYYRYEETGLLGACQAKLDIRREETVATAIVQKLIDGPDMAHTRLTGLFPQGTRVVSVTGEGATAFVTLSRDFLGKPDGAPSDWEDLTAWQEEAAARRMLAVQSLVLALTEDARYQRVQLYVADTDDDIPSRVPLYYFDLSAQDAQVVLGACARDESYLLTPQRALERVLAGWQARDWNAVYDMLAEGEALIEADAFVMQMQELDVSLLEYEVSNGSVSFDGQRATLVLSAQIRSVSGGDAQLVRESVPLYRAADNWAISLDTLKNLMVRD